MTKIQVIARRGVICLDRKEHRHERRVDVAFDGAAASRGRGLNHDGLGWRDGEREVHVTLVEGI